MSRRPAPTGSFCRFSTLLRQATMAILLLALVAGMAGSLPAASGGTLHERIDALLTEVEAGAPSPLCSDAEFLRRLSIDLLGSLPSADETRRFLADPSPHKRSYL